MCILDDNRNVTCVLMSSNRAFYVSADIQENGKNPSRQISSGQGLSRIYVGYALGNFVRSLEVLTISNQCSDLVLICLYGKFSLRVPLGANVYLINFWSCIVYWVTKRMLVNDIVHILSYCMYLMIIHLSPIWMFLARSLVISCISSMFDIWSLVSFWSVIFGMVPADRN